MPAIPPRKPKPVTAARVEAALDRLAEIMAASKRPHLGVPLYRRFEAELARLREEEATVEAARARARRLPGRTAELSG